MRIISTIKNSVYAIISSMILAILTLLVRKVFLYSLSVELLGYEGLFGNVFAILALADLGIESLILYRMFSAFAKKDTKLINVLMSVYRTLYQFVGIAILLIAICLIPFFRYIISGNSLHWNYVYLIYFIQLISTLSTYFLAYKRIIFAVSQQEFECIKVDTVVALIFSIIKIAVLLIYKNYIFYLICNLLNNILSNIIISFKVKRFFPFFETIKSIKISDIKKMGLGKDIKNNLIQKFSVTIYGGTDNIVTSIFLGIEHVGILANYMLIQNYITNFLTKLLKPFHMSIGNYVYSKNKENEEYELFEMFDTISFFIACIVSISYLCIINPFIKLWLGDFFTFEDSFVVMLMTNQYIAWNHQFLTYYRYSFGEYNIDRVPIFIAATMNIFLSVVLSRLIGITGIMLGTVIGHFGIWIGRAKVVFSVYLQNKLKTYVVKQIYKFCIWALESVLLYHFCRYMPISWIWLICRFFLCVILVCGFNAIIFFKTREMKYILKYFKKVIIIFLKKRKE